MTTRWSGSLSIGRARGAEGSDWEAHDRHLKLDTVVSIRAGEQLLMAYTP